MKNKNHTEIITSQTHPHPKTNRSFQKKQKFPLKIIFLHMAGGSITNLFFVKEKSTTKNDKEWIITSISKSSPPSIYVTSNPLPPAFLRHGLWLINSPLFHRETQWKDSNIIIVTIHRICVTFCNSDLSYHDSEIIWMDVVPQFTYKYFLDAVLKEGISISLTTPRHQEINSYVKWH